MVEEFSKITIFVGAGGVGKTTLSSLYALKERNRSTVLITIDPSKRLKDIFGLNIEESSQKINDRLSVSLSQRDFLFKEFLTSAVKDKALLERFMKNSLFERLTQNLSVSQEFTSLYELVSSSQNSDYDQIVLDTPPLQNAFDFFEGAELLRKLFAGKFFGFFLGDSERGFFSKIFNQSRELALSALKGLTGSQFIDELSDFFKLAQMIQVPLLKVLSDAEILLKDQSQLFYVTSFEELSLKRTRGSLEKLIREGYSVKKCVVNRHYASEELYDKELVNYVVTLKNQFPDIGFVFVEQTEENISNLNSLEQWSANVSFK